MVICTITYVILQLYLNMIFLFSREHVTFMNKNNQATIFQFRNLGILWFDCAPLYQKCLLGSPSFPSHSLCFSPEIIAILIYRNNKCTILFSICFETRKSTYLAFTQRHLPHSSVHVLKIHN